MLQKNYLTGVEYTGWNQERLQTVYYKEKYDSRYWLSYLQCKSIGGRIKYKAKGVRLVYCGGGKYKRFVVFNVDQCKHLPKLWPTTGEIKEYAQHLKGEVDLELEHTKAVMREIISRGGIAPHKGGFLGEEYSRIPTKYKRKNGLPMDQMAKDMGMTEAELKDEFERDRKIRESLPKLKGRSYYVIDDFLDRAEKELVEIYRLEVANGRAI